MPLASVAVVILNYNGRRHLEEFLPSVLASTYTNACFYIADNASEDDSLEYLKKLGFQLGEEGNKRLISLDKNYGFAEGYNRALAQIKGFDYFILLNSDVEVSPNWIEPLVELLEEKAEAAAVQPKILQYKNKDSFEYAGAAGGYLDKLGYPFCRGRIFEVLEPDQGQYNLQSQIFWASGAALCIRAELFEKFEGFDASYFAHMEEIDLCWRLKRAGYEIWYQGDSAVWHLGGGTLNSENPHKTYLNFRNSLYTLHKNEEDAFIKVFGRLLLDALAGARFLTQGKFAHILAIVKAHWTFFLNLPKRSKEKRATKELIAAHKIGENNKRGHWDKSILWAYFVQKEKTFSGIKGLD